MSFDKSIKKLGIEEENVVYTNESVVMFPRTLIYDLKSPDSVSYLGCMGSDRKQFVQYFENNAAAVKIPVTKQLKRVAGEYVDSFQLEPVEKKIQRFSYSDSTKVFKIENGLRYLIIFYWHPSALYRLMIKNFRFFSTYLQQHPELKAQLIPVCASIP